MTSTYETREAVRKFGAAQLIATHPHLTAAGNNALVGAAKNCRAELKRAFPKTKFSVKTSRYAGGCSMRVYWIDGPNAAQVEAIADRYQEGSFDGSNDLYTYESNAWTEAFGSAKYVFCERSFSDAFVGKILARINRLYGTMATVEDFRTGKTWNLRDAGGGDIGREINQALYRHTCEL